jgi:hypothetical protein
MELSCALDVIWLSSRHPLMKFPENVPCASDSARE